MYKRLHVSGIAPAKRGVPVLLHVFAVEIISIHAPVWGRVRHITAYYLGSKFQFTPPCGGGVKCVYGISVRQISIHAPVWGRGYYTGERIDYGVRISIHAPVWGRGGDADPTSKGGSDSI